LSGGLDSSIVATCLGKGTTDAEIVFFHFFTEIAEGDERKFARLAAQIAGRELVESEARVSERTLDRLLSPSRIATPAVLGFLPTTELLKQRLVRERRAGAIFTGQGGDHLFQQERSKHIAGEYAHRHGLRPQLFDIVADTSRLTKQSIWTVLSAALRYGLLRRPFDPYVIYQAPSILSDSARASLSPRAYTHPWVENANRLPASKIQQVLDVVDCQAFFLRPCTSAEQIHPLISLPIVECCLQIPTYVLAHRGRDRGLVREAFEADLPAKIIRRYTKGGTTSYFNRLLVENVAFVREFLLDGALVRNGVLDRRELEKQLSERELILGQRLHSVVNAVRAEKWLTNWADVRQRTAA
jgi:asparagine synthase (glutamine-hydrolysing)